MFNMARTTALSAVIVASSLTATTSPSPVQAQTYAIDCAILLCLAGGFPPSVPCARARAEFIRRVTPWPVEPPLQIWRCPMGVSYKVDPSESSAARLYEVLFDSMESAPLQSLPEQPFDRLEPEPAIIRNSGGTAQRLPDGFLLQLIQDGEFSTDNGTADIDISSSAFDFVRSIRVYNVTASQLLQGSDGGYCTRSGSVRLGSYGTQGDFRWDRASLSSLPAAHTGLVGFGEDCPSVFHRSVFVDWRDHAGNYGFEQVNY